MPAPYPKTPKWADQPRNIEQLRKILLKYTKDITERKSPAGFDEFIIPDKAYDSYAGDTPLGKSAALTGGYITEPEHFLTTNGRLPYSIYKQSWGDINNVQEHERVHQGEQFLRNKPHWVDRLKALGIDINNESEVFKYGPWSPADEHAAYKFAPEPGDKESRSDKAKRFAVWMNILKEADPERFVSAEASMPPIMMYDYLTQGRQSLPKLKIPKINVIEQQYAPTEPTYWNK